MIRAYRCPPPAKLPGCFRCVRCHLTGLLAAGEAPVDPKGKALLAARPGKDAVLFAHGYLGRNVKKPRFILTHAVGANQTFDFCPDIFVDTTDVIDKLARVMNEL